MPGKCRKAFQRALPRAATDSFGEVRGLNLGPFDELAARLRGGPGVAADRRVLVYDVFELPFIFR